MRPSRTFVSMLATSLALTLLSGAKIALADQTPSHLTFRAGEKKINFSARELGMTIDPLWLEAQKRYPNEATRRVQAPLSFDRDRVLGAIKDFSLRVDRMPRGARRDSNGGYLAPVDGVRVDVWKSLDRVLRLRSSAKLVDLVTVIERAPRSEAASDAAAFEETLAEFRTHFASTKKDRTTNLLVAANKIDGTIVGPGQVFDFNRVVGERSESNGFVPATVISGGELADGLGGGACQIAGTLHAAALFSGMKVVERHPHSRPSSYIRLGLDATVSYPKLNFRFRNPYPFPVAIGLTLEKSQTVARIFGKQAKGRVRVVRRIDGFRPYEEKVIVDPKLAPGLRILRQRGVPGFSLDVMRYVEDGFGHVRRDRYDNEYPPTTQIWRVGVAREPVKIQLDDTHKEYRAHQYVSMNWDAELQKLSVSQKEGSTGYFGWTEKEKMPQVPEAKP